VAVVRERVIDIEGLSDGWRQPYANSEALALRACYPCGNALQPIRKVPKHALGGCISLSDDFPDSLLVRLLVVLGVSCDDHSGDPDVWNEMSTRSEDDGNHRPTRGGPGRGWAGAPCRDTAPPPNGAPPPCHLVRRRAWPGSWYGVR